MTSLLSAAKFEILKNPIAILFFLIFISIATASLVLLLIIVLVLSDFHFVSLMLLLFSFTATLFLNVGVISYSMYSSFTRWKFRLFVIILSFITMLISFASLYFSLQLIFEYSYVFNEALIQNGTVQEREVIRLPLSRREPPVWVYEKSPLNPTAKITLTPRSLGAVLELAVDCFHFSTVTATTLGYGDILPNLWYTKLLADLQCLLGISIITISIGLYLRGRDIGTRKES